MDNNTLHISISNMDIYLGECFLKSITNRPPRLHNHPCYELVLVDGNDGARFIITPPLLEHIAVDPSYQNVTSLLFDFNSQDAGFFNVLRQIKSPISVYDAFDGALRIKSVKQLLNQKSFGFKEQIKAELNLFFVALVRALYSNEKLSENNLHFLDQERIMLLEEYFNIRIKSPACSKKDLASRLGVCERQLTRILKNVYGSTFSQLLIRSRMTIAQAMREEGKKTATQIATENGYTSVASFKRAYAQFYGYPFKLNSK